MSNENFERKITFFRNKGSRNTSDCFNLVAERINKLGLEYLVVASTSGETGARAVDFFDKFNVKVVVVSHQYGFKEDGKIEMEKEYRKKIEKSENTALVTNSDVLTRIPKIIREKYGGCTYLDLIADTLRILSEGTKVCTECVIKAADSGNIPVNEEVAAIAGTEHGADTGIVIKSQHSHKLLDIDIREIICMPREK